VFIVASIQSTSADHLELGGKGIFAGPEDANLDYLGDSKYKIHLQVVVRDSQGALVSVLETTSGEYLPNEITDGLFDQKFGEKEIVTVDDVKYEKVRITDTPTLEQRLVGLYPILSEKPMEINIQTSKAPEWASNWMIHYCADFKGHGLTCVPIFTTFAATAALTEGDVVVNQWTILRELS
jgi:hypothetical protein